jgi:hypothetical protein
MTRLAMLADAAASQNMKRRMTIAVLFPPMFALPNFNARRFKTQNVLLCGYGARQYGGKKGCSEADGYALCQRPLD